MVDKLVAVLDVGKTLAKLSLWTRDGVQIAKNVRKNRVIAGGDYPSLDIDGIAGWLAPALSTLIRQNGAIDAFIPVAHGAAAVVVRDGAVLMPPCDYEFPIPEDIKNDYERQRDSFAQSGSPALANALNLGSQLAYLETLRGPLSQDQTQILLWPQFWSWWMSGVASSEMSSLGCHTDLWRPLAKTYSNLARQRGWADLFPPLRKAGDILGPLSDQWMTRCQLQNPVDVHCGIHDSNAALIAARGIPDINKGEATIISTGTWFVAMRAPATSLAFGLASLDPARDCLVNVDIEGRPVPSARFMGGREIELLIANGNYQLEAAEDQDAMVAAVPSIIDRGAMIRPGTVAGVGPFPAGKGGWINMPTDNIARRTAIAIYVALIADTCLDLIESRHKILVEGRFAGSAVFMRALATLRPNQIILAAEADNDVSFGALRVITPKLRSRVTTRIAQQLPVDLKRYKAMWQSLALSESII